jgi:hypothetical protein
MSMLPLLSALVVRTEARFRERVTVVKTDTIDLSSPV